MSFIEWRDHFSVGVEVIDDDHRKLVAMINELYEAIRLNAEALHIGAILDGLADYVVVHFKREEGMMAEHGYPAFERHMEAHNKFVAQTWEVIDSFNAGNHDVASIELLNTLRDWLMNHILKTDMRYKPFFESKGLGIKRANREEVEGGTFLTTIAGRAYGTILALFLTIVGFSVWGYVQIYSQAPLLAEIQANAEQVARSAGASVETDRLLASIQEVMAGNESMAVTNAVPLIIGLIMSLLGFVVIHRVVQGLSGLTGSVRQLMAGDLQTHFPLVESRDELGVIARSLKSLKYSWQEAEQLAQQQQSSQAASDQQALQVLKLTSAFEATLQTVVDIVAAASSELQATARNMDETANRTSKQASIVANASDIAAENIQGVASATQELLSSTDEINRQVEQSSTSAMDADAEAKETAGQMKELSEAAASIGEVVGLITDIADKTNLLALNATIEAARAGEAGKGFAVVAGEVKNLANQTARATEEIERQILGIQQITAKAVTAIDGIGQRISGINEVSQVIAGTVSEQRHATHEIAQAVDQVAMGTSEVTSNIQAVTNATEDTRHAASEVLNAAGELSHQAEELRNEVDTYLKGVNALL